MTDAAQSDPKFDVAVSFAGEDRELVEEVVQRLKAADLRVFYDHDYAVDTWGEDLVEYFDDIYRNQARYTLMFISQHYADKMWPRHERRSALARGLQQATPYVLPVRLDDVALPGLRPTVGYLDARKLGVDGLARSVQEKLGRASSIGTQTVNRVPRTEAERQQILSLRPPAWEYLYFGSELLHGKSTVESHYRDHRLRFAQRTGQRITRTELSGFVQTAADEAQRIVAILLKVMEPAAQQAAFGLPGEAGDPEMIRHLADRWTDSYDALMQWAANLRGTTVPSQFTRLVDLLACCVDKPIEDYRRFIDDLVEQLDSVPAALAAGRRPEITLTLALDIPDEVTEAFDAELRRVQ